MLDIWGRYFWLIALAVSLVNAVWVWMRSRAEVARDPDLGAGYAKLVIGYLTVANLPWFVMGYGIVIGGVPSLWYYFRPQDGDPYVLMWFASILVLWALGTAWVYAWGGAEMLARHPATFNFRAYASSARFIKAIWAIGLIGGIMGFVGMWLMDIPVDALSLL